VPAFIVSQLRAAMASVFWILFIATGEWNVEPNSVSKWKAKAFISVRESRGNFVFVDWA